MHLDVLRREFHEEPARVGAVVLSEEPASSGHCEEEILLGPGHPHVTKASFLLHLHRFPVCPVMRQEVLLHPGKKDNRKLEPLCHVQCHEGDGRVPFLPTVDVRNQGYLVHECRKGLGPSPCASFPFIEEVGYNRLKVLIDPAEVLVYDSLERVFSLLAEFILFGCAKDVTVDTGGDPTFAPAGQGQVDYHRYVELLMSHEVPVLIVEQVTRETLEPTLDFLRGVIADVQGSAR